MSIHWSVNNWMWPLLLILAVGAILWTIHIYRLTRPLPAPTLRRLFTTLRSVVLGLLALAIAGPVISNLQRSEVPAELIIVLEDSASMKIVDSPAGGSAGEVARWNHALAVADRLEEKFSDHQPPVNILFFRGNGLSPLREFRISDPVIAEPSGYGSDLTGLTAAVQARLMGHNARAWVLLSDGQETVQEGRRGLLGGTHNRNRTRFSPGGQISSAERDFFVLGVGDPTGPADRVLKELRYPESAFQDDEITVEIGVTHRFTSGRELTPVKATLRNQAGEIAAEKIVAVAEGVTTINLDFIPGQSGLLVYSLELSALVNERYLENNKASIAVNVARDRSRLLVFAEKPSWDTRFLAQAANIEQRLEMSLVYRASSGLVFADSMVSWQSPQTVDQWLEYDGVVFTSWARIAASVDLPSLNAAVEQGLGLLFLTGPEMVGNLSGQSAIPPRALADLLPVSSSSWNWNRGSFNIRPVSGQRSHPLLAGTLNATEPGDSRSGLALLPPLKAVAAVKTRPGAITLLETANPTGKDGKFNWPLLVADASGMGQVIWFGGRPLWELAFWEPAVSTADVDSNAEQPARRLLRNLLVWTVGGEDSAGLALVGRRAMFHEGERVKLAARWRDMRGQPVVGRQLSLHLGEVSATGDTIPSRVFAMSESSLDPGQWDVDLQPLPPGSYFIQLVGAGDAVVYGKRESLIVTSHSIENTQVRLDGRRLRQLSALGSGKYYGPATAANQDSLVVDLFAVNWAGLPEEKRARLDLLSSWPFLVVISLLLGIEWFLRRRHGLL